MPSDQELWSEAADKYHQFVGSPQDALRTEVLYPAIFELLGNMQGKRLLDIGCGNGLFAYEEAKKGSQVDAFDNANMIKIAQENFSHSNIQFQSLDANQKFPYPDKTFDYITANMVLMDMADIQNLLKESDRVLRDDGKMIISILHPAFTPPVGRFRRGLRGRINKKYAYFHLQNYFSPPPVQKNLVGKQTNYYHRTISEYAHAFRKNHLVIVDIFEPKPSSNLIKTYPHFFHAEKIAIFLVFILSKRHELY